MKYTCTNKHCRHNFYSSEDTVIILCPCCNAQIINKDKVINTDNFLWIEAMIKNIETYGKEETLKMIDKNYINPVTRIKVRKMYFDTLAILEKV